MTYTPIAKGTTNWDVPLNAALAQLDSNISSNASAALQAANNLSDLTNKVQARNNLQISQGYVQGVNQFNVKDYSAVGNGTADDTTALQNTINAANTAGGGIVYLPPGNYKISSALTLYSHIALMGAGDTVTTITQSSTTANGLTGSGLAYITVASLKLVGPASGSGVGIALTTTLDSSIFRDMTVASWGGNGIDIQQPTTCSFTRVTSNNNGGTGIYLHGAAGTGNSISLHSCYAHDNGANGYWLASMNYCAFVGCSAANHTVATKAGYLIDTSSAVSVTGCGSTNNIIGVEITGSGNHTVNSFFNSASPASGVGFYVTGSAANVQLRGIVESSPNASATNWIKTDTGTNVTIQGSVHTTANSYAAGTVVDLENSSGVLASSGDVGNGRNTIVGGTASLGDNGIGELQVANATSVPTTNPTNGALVYASAGSLSVRDSSGNITDFSKLTTLQASPGPNTQGFISWNYDTEIATATGAGANTSGTIYLHRIYLPNNKVISNIAVGIQTAGATLTSGQNFVGLYSSAGTRLAVSADQSTSWTSTGYKSIALTSPYTTTASGHYYVAILAVGTTPPAFYQAANAPSALFNANLSAGTFRHCSDGTGQTSLPASLTLGSSVSSTVNSWVAVL